MRREEFKSDEEFQFYIWLLDCVKFGYISDWAYEPTTYMIHKQVAFEKTVFMKTKTKVEKKKLFTNADNLTYTPDFVFKVTSKGHLMWRDTVFARSIQMNKRAEIVYVDVKGEYNPYGGDHRAFFLKQRMMWDMHHIYVEKLTPKSLFRATFAPESMRWCKGRKAPTMTKLGTKTKSSREYGEANIWKLRADFIDDVML